MDRYQNKKKRKLLKIKLNIWFIRIYLRVKCQDVKWHEWDYNSITGKTHDLERWVDLNKPK